MSDDEQQHIPGYLRNLRTLPAAALLKMRRQGRRAISSLDKACIDKELERRRLEERAAKAAVAGPVTASEPAKTAKAKGAKKREQQQHVGDEEDEPAPAGAPAAVAAAADDKVEAIKRRIEEQKRQREVAQAEASRDQHASEAMSSKAKAKEKKKKKAGREQAASEAETATATTTTTSVKKGWKALPIVLPRLRRSEDSNDDNAVEEKMPSFAQVVGTSVEPAWENADATAYAVDAGVLDIQSAQDFPCLGPGTGRPRPPTVSASASLAPPPMALSSSLPTRPSAPAPSRAGTMADNKLELPPLARRDSDPNLPVQARQVNPEQEQQRARTLVELADQLGIDGSAVRGLLSKSEAELVTDRACQQASLPPVLSLVFEPTHACYRPWRLQPLRETRPPRSLPLLSTKHNKFAVG